MSRHEIPARWQDAVRQHIRATTGEERGHLLAYGDGSRSVPLAFPDGSHAFFRSAFHLREGAKEVAVFTHHCGYHFFPGADLEADALQSVRDHADDGEDSRA